MKRGEVYCADLVPRSGSEQTGRRPVILVSHDGFNQTSSQGNRGPTAIELSGGVAGLPKTGFAVCHQVTTLDRAKLTKRIGMLPTEFLREVEEGLKAAMESSWHLYGRILGGPSWTVAPRKPRFPTY